MTTLPAALPYDRDATPRGGAASRLAAQALEAARYLAASVAALALDAGVLWLLVESARIAPWLGGAIAYGAGLVLVYFVSIRWVFARRAVRDPRAEFVAFAVLGAIGLVLNSVVLSIALSAGLSLVVAKAIAAAFGFVANFVSRKALLFTNRKASADA